MHEDNNHCMRDYIYCAWCGKRIKWGSQYYKITTTEDVIPNEENYFCSKDCVNEFVDAEVIGAFVLY